MPVHIINPSGTVEDTLDLKLSKHRERKRVRERERKREREREREREMRLCSWETVDTTAHHTIGFHNFYTYSTGDE